MPGESNIWKIGLYQKCPPDLAKCLECNANLKTPKANTSTLIHHLKTKHKGSEYEKKYNNFAQKEDAQINLIEKHVSITGSG
jgi:hypothetical protein